MLNPELTRALADDHIRELHRQAAHHHLPTSAPTARFLGLRSVAGALTHVHRHARKAATTTAAAASSAGTAVSTAATDRAGAATGGSPVGCVA